MQFEGHTDSWCYDPVQQVHICKHPFISRRCYTEVSLEECMKAIEEWLQAAKHTVINTQGGVYNSARPAICMAWWSHLADMLWEAVPSALLPRIHRPKQRLISGESLSQVTG